MAAPATTLYAAGIAFAAGVVATAAFVTLNSGGAPIAPAGQSEPRSTPSRVADRHWSDPVKSPGSSSATRQEARTPLTFHVDRADEQPRAGQPKEAEAEAPKAGQSGQERAEGTKATVAQLTVKPEHERADAVRTELAKKERGRAHQARLEMLEGQRNRAERARSEQARTTEVGDATRRFQTNATRNRVVQVKPSVPAEQGLRRKAAPVLVTNSSESGRDSLAALKHARRIVTQPRAFRYAEARPYDEDSQLDATPQSRAPDRDAREPSRRISSADAGGVMRWLMEPGGRF